MQELFAQGLANDVPQLQAARAAGFTGSSISTTACRLAKAPHVISRVRELKLMAEEAKANAVKTTFETALSHVPENARAFVAQSVRERQYRLTVIQDVVDRLRMVIDERAAYGRSLGEDKAAPGAASGLLVRRQRMIGSGKKAIRIVEWVTDGEIISKLYEGLKQAAIETGDWEDKHRIVEDRGPDLSHLTTEQLLEEQKILREARERLEAVRQSKPQRVLIEAAPGSVDVVAEVGSGERATTTEYPTL